MNWIGAKSHFGCHRVAASIVRRNSSSLASTSSRRSSGSTADNKREGEGPIRLGKALSRAGVASRRKSEEIIFEGRVTVNGQTVSKPETRISWGVDRIELDGVTLLTSKSQGRQKGSNQELFHFMVNKPKGYICSNNSIESSKVLPVVELLKPWIDKWTEKKMDQASVGENSLMLPPRFFSVGRLDVATTGLLLLTNDGEWANSIAHPKYEVLKEYIVTCATKIKLSHLKKIFEGTMVEDTFVTPKSVEFFDPSRQTGDPKIDYKIRIVVGEGKKHEVRELVASAGLKVTALKRVRVGKLELGSLAIGRYRRLNKKEIYMAKSKGAG